jgi:hypothetical protein
MHDSVSNPEKITLKSYWLSISNELKAEIKASFDAEYGYSEKQFFWKLRNNSFRGYQKKFLFNMINPQNVSIEDFFEYAPD